MIGIVILNYNSYPETIRLVEALQQQTVASDLKIVVVDNASPNDSFSHLQPLEEKYDHVYVLRTGENLGYAKGNNFGLNYLDKHIKPEYAAILNNDVVLPDDCFEKLVTRYQTLDNPCIIAPLQLTPEGKSSVLGEPATFGKDLLRLSYIYRFLHKNKFRPYDNTGGNAMRIELVSGSFMFASLKRFKHIGYFYPGTFLYAEERFVAYAAKENGYNNYILLDETYMHDHSTTISAHYNTYGMYKMCYDSWLEYTKVCRRNGKIKALILKPLTKLSLLEIKVIRLLKKDKKK